jgi:hypothetical protein
MAEGNKVDVHLISQNSGDPAGGGKVDWQTRSGANDAWLLKILLHFSGVSGVLIVSWPLSHCEKSIPVVVDSPALHLHQWSKRELNRPFSNNNTQSWDANFAGVPLQPLLLCLTQD